MVCGTNKLFSKQVQSSDGLREGREPHLAVVKATIPFLENRRHVDLPTGGHTGSTGDELLSQSPSAKATSFVCK